MKIKTFTVFNKTVQTKSCLEVFVKCPDISPEKNKMSRQKLQSFDLKKEL